jgi:hypothetical protein
MYYLVVPNTEFKLASVFFHIDAYLLDVARLSAGNSSRSNLASELRSLIYIMQSSSFNTVRPTRHISVAATIASKYFTTERWNYFCRKRGSSRPHGVAKQRKTAAAAAITKHRWLLSGSKTVMRMCERNAPKPAKYWM